MGLMKELLQSSSGPQWCSSADQSSSLPPAVATMQRFDIKMMLIVHYSKIQGLNKHIYTCRALGDGGQSITASKTYEQYLGETHAFLRNEQLLTISSKDLSWRLSEAFPHISQKHLPRLHKKSALFVTRSTLLQRKEDLDIWVRRIASIPEVRSSKPLLDFLHDDNWGQPPTVDLKQRPVASSSYSHPRPSLTLGQSTPSPSPRRAEFAAKELPPLPSSAAGRPALAHKRSTPNLRSRPDFLEFDAPPTPAPPLHFQSGGRKSPAAAPSVLSLASRPSMDSVARSVSTDHTVTPASIQASLSRATSPSSPPAPSPASSDTLKANSLRGPKPTLRNFTSLQDLVSRSTHLLA